MKYRSEEGGRGYWPDEREGGREEMGYAYDEVQEEEEDLSQRKNMKEKGH